MYTYIVHAERLSSTFSQTTVIGWSLTHTADGKGDSYFRPQKG